MFSAFLLMASILSAPADAGVYVSVSLPLALDVWAPSYVPPARTGWVWVAGHYDGWGSWIPGHWRPTYARAGYDWVPGYWVGSVYYDGYWRPLARAGYNWVPGYWAPADSSDASREAAEPSERDDSRVSVPDAPPPEPPSASDDIHHDYE